MAGVVFIYEQCPMIDADDVIDILSIMEDDESNAHCSQIVCAIRNYMIVRDPGRLFSVQRSLVELTTTRLVLNAAVEKQIPLCVIGNCVYLGYDSDKGERIMKPCTVHGTGSKYRNTTPAATNVAESMIKKKME